MLVIGVAIYVEFAVPAAMQLIIYRIKRKNKLENAITLKLKSLAFGGLSFLFYSYLNYAASRDQCPPASIQLRRRCHLSMFEDISNRRVFGNEYGLLFAAMRGIHAHVADDVLSTLSVIPINPPAGRGSSGSPSRYLRRMQNMVSRQCRCHNPRPYSPNGPMMPVVRQAFVVPAIQSMLDSSYSLK
jgi:hypothetical protein